MVFCKNPRPLLSQRRPCEINIGTWRNGTSKPFLYCFSNRAGAEVLKCRPVWRVDPPNVCYSTLGRHESGRCAETAALERLRNLNGNCHEKINKINKLQAFIKFRVKSLRAPDKLRLKGRKDKFSRTAHGLRGNSSRPSSARSSCAMSRSTIYEAKKASCDSRSRGLLAHDAD
jgi:hypothetical protein